MISRALRLAAAPTIAGVSVLVATQDAPKEKSAPIPHILQQSFAPPKDAYFVAGTLLVEHHMPPINLVQQHLLGIVPPAGEQRTIVRHSVDTGSGKVTWFRVFGDGQSTFSTVWTMDGPAAPASERFAGAVDIAQRLECSTAAPGGGLRATLRHVSTSLLGIFPVPVMLLTTHCVMDVQEDGKGYDLSVNVTMAGWPMVSYTGQLRECEGTPSEFLSMREAKVMGLALGKG